MVHDPFEEVQFTVDRQRRIEGIGPREIVVEARQGNRAGPRARGACVDVLVDRGREDGAAPLLGVRRAVGSSPAEADAQRRFGAKDHGPPIFRERGSSVNVEVGGRHEPRGIGGERCRDGGEPRSTRAWGLIAMPGVASRGRGGSSTSYRRRGLISTPRGGWRIAANSTWPARGAPAFRCHGKRHPRGARAVVPRRPSAGNGRARDSTDRRVARPGMARGSM